MAVGSKPAIHDRHGTLTWRELDDRANRLANTLTGMGLRGGDRLAILLRNGREFAEAILAAQKIGVVACPLNTWAKTRELRDSLESVDAKALVFDALHAEQVGGVDLEELPAIVVGDRKTSPIPAEAYEDALAAASDAPPPPFTRRRGSSRVVIHTSGTTGRPKGAARDASRTGVREFIALLRVVPFRRDDVIVCPAPLFHSFGLLTLTIGSILGATLVLPERFDPEGTLAAIEEHGATVASMVPVMIHRVLSLPDDVKAAHDVSSLRILLASGSAIPPDLRGQIEDLFGPVLYDLYGSTEAGWVSIATPEDMRERPDTAGRPVSGVDVGVFSPHGIRLPAGQTGELFVKSSALFEGYTSGEERKHHGPYMSLGDLGRLDRDGYLFVEGRADDMVVVGGENVYPREIEDVVRQVPGVRDVAVFGAPDPEYGHTIVAFVVGDVEPDAVIEASKSQLASFKVPRRVEKVKELPRTSTGKVLKRELIRPAGSEPSRPGSPRPRRAGRTAS
ncbi:MAG: AMP-binding protein [Actinomycetota bacterium]|nr:AMP-binding protein [Actinomycetota bacterium]